MRSVLGEFGMKLPAFIHPPRTNCQPNTSNVGFLYLGPQSYRTYHTHYGGSL